MYSPLANPQFVHVLLAIPPTLTQNELGDNPGEADGLGDALGDKLGLAEGDWLGLADGD